MDLQRHPPLTLRVGGINLVVQGPLCLPTLVDHIYLAAIGVA